MKKNLSIAIIATSVLGLGSLSSCQDSEVENIEQVAFQHGYESGFVKTFGNVDPNQTWDFTSYARHQRNCRNQPAFDRRRCGHYFQGSWKT